MADGMLMQSVHGAQVGERRSIAALHGIPVTIFKPSWTSSILFFERAPTFSFMLLLSTDLIWVGLTTHFLDKLTSPFFK